MIILDPAVPTATPFHLVGSGTSGPGAFAFVTHVGFHPVPLVALALAAGAYARGVRSVRLRGERWSRRRSAAWGIGIAALAFATLSGLDAYDRVDFTVAALQQALIAFVAPVFLALGAPLTLVRSAVGPAAQARLRRLVVSRAARIASYPLVTAVAFGGCLFALYFTPAFSVGLEHPAVWDLENLALLATGCGFAWPLAAVDPLPRVLGHGRRMVWLLLTVPFFSLLGMALESGGGIAPGIGRAQVKAGGDVLWLIGELAGLLGMVAVLVSWCRLEERSAARRDHVLDPEAALQLAHWRASRRAAHEAAGLVAPRRH